MQIADADGKVTFTSFVPACYPGRWPHVHFEVFPDQAGIADPTAAIATSQVALPQDVCEQVFATAGYEASVADLARVSLDSDNVLGGRRPRRRRQPARHRQGDVTSGCTVSLAVGVDTTTPTGGQLSGDGAPSGAPPGGGPAGTPPARPTP